MDQVYHKIEELWVEKSFYIKIINEVIWYWRNKVKRNQAETKLLEIKIVEN